MKGCKTWAAALVVLCGVWGCTPSNDIVQPAPNGGDAHAISVAENFGAAAIELVAANPQSPLLFPQEELRVRSIETDDIGTTHVRLDQFYQSLPVIGGEAIAHFPNQTTPEIFAQYVVLALYPTPVGLDTTTAHSTSAARKVAAQTLEGVANDCATCPAQLAVFFAPASSHREAAGAARLVFQVDAKVNAINSYRLLVDANTLGVLEKTPLSLSIRN